MQTKDARTHSQTRIYTASTYRRRKKEFEEEPNKEYCMEEERLNRNKTNEMEKKKKEPINVALKQWENEPIRSSTHSIA